MPTLQEKIYIRSHSAWKNLFQIANRLDQNPKHVLFIFGCQRSGTRLMATMLQKDRRSRVYYEQSRLSDSKSESRLRFRPLRDVESLINSQPAPLVVTKPLVESQHASTILEHFAQAHGLWIFRHYQDVIASNLAKFGMSNGIDDIRPIARNDLENWRSEAVSDEVRSLVGSYFSENMNPFDAAALFWFARNSLFFDQKLSNHPRILMCRYHELVENPTDMMRLLYQFMGLEYPGDYIIESVHTASVGKGRNVSLSPEIQALCDKMYTDLTEVFFAQDRLRSVPALTNSK